MSVFNLAVIARLNFVRRCSKSAEYRNKKVDHHAACEHNWRKLLLNNDFTDFCDVGLEEKEY